ncbi:MAG: HEAT repeat domain-containing protein [Gemmatales bacterium]
MNMRSKVVYVMLTFGLFSVLLWAIASREIPSVNDVQMLVACYRQGDVECNAQKLYSYCNSSNDMVKYYAINSIGDIGAEGVIFLNYLALLLDNDDPFVRDAAAHSILKLAHHGKVTSISLVRIIYSHVNESAARYAVDALGEYGDRDSSIIECIAYAYNAKDTACRQAATKAYRKITGNEIQNVVSK